MHAERFSIISIFSKVKIYERKIRIEKEIVQEKKNATILLFFNSVMSLYFLCSSLLFFIKCA